MSINLILSVKVILTFPELVAKAEKVLELIQNKSKRVNLALLNPQFGVC